MMANFERTQARNRRSAVLLAVALFVVLALLVGLVGSYLGVGGPAGIALAGLVSGATSWISWSRSDRIVLAMTKARVVDASTHPQLCNVVEELCVAAGLPVPRVAVVEDPAPNAFATGRDPTRAVVAVTTGLLERMDREELQGVVAHELAHIANRDTLVMTIAATTAGLIALVSDVLLRFLQFGGGRRSRRSGNGNGAGALLLVGVLVAAVLAPLAAALLRSALSRSREGLADATAVAYTRNPAGLRRALQRLAADSTVVRARSTSVAHLWIECPLDTKQGMNRLFATHPPIADRIQALWRLEGNVGSPPDLSPNGSGGAAS